MKKTLLLHIFIFLALAEVSGQYYTNQNKIWAFGFHGGLNFSTGSPVPFSSNINTTEGTASVSNAAGTLLFYSDGYYVYNSSGTIMTHGSTIVPYSTSSTTQAALIIPVPGNANQYYLFSLESLGGSGRLDYCIVDMTLGGGSGDVVSTTLATSLATGMSEGMIAVAGNSCDIWLVTHKQASPIFWAYDITTAGIGAPVVSSVGTFTTGGTPYGIGVLKASPNRTKIVAQEYTSATGTELYDFNPTTGVVSNCQVLNTGTCQYGAEFSPDNTKLYAEQFCGSTIVQYDITLSTTTAIVASETTVATAVSGDIKLGPDGKIYTVSSAYLGCISSPNVAGTGCGYTSDAVTLTTGTHCVFGLPNLFISVAPNDTFYAVQDTSVCIPAGGSITITAHDTLIGSGYLWNDGVTTTRSRSITAYGIYWVEIYNGCGLTMDTVHVLPLLADSLTGAATLCSSATTTLTPAITGGAWSSTSASVATVGTTTGIVTGVATGTTTISYNLSAHCPALITVTVNPAPTSIAGLLSICAGGSTLLSDGTSGGSWSSSNTAVATVNAGTGTVTGQSAGTATITYGLADGCFPTVAIVTVNALPPAITGTMHVCTGFTTTLSDIASGGIWSSANTVIATAGVSSGIVSGIIGGTTTISYVLPTGCGTATIATVNPTPPSITGTSIVCAGATTTLYSGSTGPLSGGIWSSSNTAIATIGSSSGAVGGVAGGAASITYTLPTGCNTIFPITVSPQPVPINGILNLCIETTTTLADSTAGGVWSSSNTSIATVDALFGTLSTGFATGTATISYTLGSGCAATTIVTVGVGPLPISGTLTLCPRATTVLSDGIGGGTWSSDASGNATVDGSGNVYGVSTGTATISYSLGSCAVIAIVTVNTLPSLITGVSEVCVGLATLLSDATTGGAWSSSNASIASIVTTSGILTGGIAGTATISYTLPDGCAATTLVTVNSAAPAITGVTHVCPGATTVLIDGGGSWSSSNTAIATIGTSGVVGGVAPGTASIDYSIGAGCSTSTTITVNPLPAAISGTAILCAGTTTMLSDGAGTWSSGSMIVATIGSASGIVNGIAGGTAAITYTAAATGCTAIRTITINPLPLAITGTLSVCSGATTSLGDLTTGGNWSSGTTTIATISSAGMLTGLAPGTSVITYTNPASGCSRTVVVTVNPLPAVPSTSGTLSICGGATTTLTDATTGGLWSSSAGSIATVTTTTGIVRGVSAGTAVVSYILATGCARATVVTINPLPAAIIGPTAECVGAMIMEDESLAGGYWTSSVATVATVGSAGNVTGVATGTTVITYTFPIAIGTGCRATTTITVSLSPTGIIGGPTVCANDTTTLSDAVGGGVWSSDNTAAATVGSLSGTVTGVTIGTTLITYSLGSTGSLSTGCTVTRILTVNAAPDGITGITGVCAGATTTLADATIGGTWSSSATSIATVAAGTGGSAVVTGGTEGTDTITYTQGGCAVNTIITVNLTPSAITGAGSVCAGDSTALSDAVSGGVWTSGNTGVAIVSAGVGAGAVMVTGIVSGTTTVTYSLGAGCAITKIIRVNPISAISGSMGMCLGTTTTLSDAATGGTWSSSATAIASVNTRGVITGALAGTTVITYTTTAGCTAAAVITVNLAPSAISGALHVCAGATTTLENTAGGGVWTSSNTEIGTINSTGIVTGIIPGTTVISYSLGSGCIVTAIVTVNAVPAEITGIMAICAGTTTALGDVSTGGVWSPAVGGIATVSGTGVVSGVSAGTVVVSCEFATGCAATALVTVNPIPATITGTTGICAGLTAALSSATTGGAWSSSSAIVASADPVLGIVTGVAPGTTVITYTLPSGCNTATAVTINAAPAAMSGSMAVCIGSTTTLSDPSAGGAWSSGNTGVALVSSGTVNGIGLGTATISYTVGGCPATAVVTVNSLPDAISGTSVCVGSTETLTDLPDGGTWSSSNTSIATIDETEGIVTGMSAGTATIAYSLGAGCTITAAVIVDALPGAITGTPEVCLGYITTLIDAAGGGVWSSSNTAIAIVSGTGTVSGVAGGPLTISYTSRATGCAATRLVTVVAVPAITGVSDMCAFGALMDVSDSLAGGTWTSTSVTVSTAGVVTPYSAGAASLTYTIPLGCYTTTSFTVHSLPGPVTGDFHFCVGLSVALGDTTAGGIWHSSNTAVASINTAGMVRGVSGGTAIISYVLPTGCMETETIIVDSLPVAGTITGLPVVCVDAAIGLSVVSASPLLTGGVWSSSNASADVLGGIVSGVSAGVDTIKYTVSNSCGSATATKTIVVNPPPEAGTVSGPVTVCVDDSIILYDAVPGGIWSSSVAAITGGIVHGITTGTDTIRYSVTNSCGTAVAAKTVTVNTLPDAGSIGLLDTICTGFTYLLTDSIPGGEWSTSNSSSLNISATGLISALLAGVDTISYSLTNMCGTSLASATIAVKAMSTPDTITGFGYVCVGGVDTLIAAPQGGVWGSSNTTATITSTATGAIISGILPGTDTISYTMPGECGGVGTIFPITVLSLNQCDSNTGISPGLSKGDEMLRVWPNPNEGMFTVLLIANTNEPVQMTIINIVGEKVKELTTITNKATEIKLNYASGVYFISASTAQGSYEAKVVIAK